MASIGNSGSQRVQLLVPLTILPQAPKLAFKLAEGLQLRMQFLGQIPERRHSCFTRSRGGCAPAEWKAAQVWL